jgi:hypothetical protein
MERIGGRLWLAGPGGTQVVEGRAGIGKTVLLAPAGTWPRAGFRVLWAPGAELERECAFGVVRQLVEPMVEAASEQDGLVG